MPIPEDERYPEFSRSDLGVRPWNEYRTANPQQARRIEGPFFVHTGKDGGKVFCEDGYLLIDAFGRPFPMEKEPFESVYQLKEVVDFREKYEECKEDLAGDPQMSKTKQLVRTITLTRWDKDGKEQTYPVDVYIEMKVGTALKKKK